MGMWIIPAPDKEIAGWGWRIHFETKHYEDVMRVTLQIAAIAGTCGSAIPDYPQVRKTVSLGSL
jgi:hypothetical protein